jgi:hypothetical protein
VVALKDEKSVWDLEVFPSRLREGGAHFCNSMTAIVIGGNPRRAPPLVMECANIAIQLGQGGLPCSGSIGRRRAWHIVDLLKEAS